MLRIDRFLEYRSGQCPQRRACARIDARYGLDVFWKAFLANRAGLSFGRALALRSATSTLVAAPPSNIAAERFRCERRCVACASAMAVWRASSWTPARTKPPTYTCWRCPTRLPSTLLPTALVEREPLFANCAGCRVSPITGVHFWFDRDVMAEPFLTAVDTTTQWIFNKSCLYGQGGGRYLQLVISASYDLMPRPRQEIIDLCRRELLGLLPDTRQANLVKATVIKEAAATFSPEPGSDRWRPSQRSPLATLYLAGDWTKTNWPDTMDGGVRSGYLAAEAVLDAAGAPRKLLRPDLSAEGLSWWLA